jgi:hypothetical protein
MGCVTNVTIAILLNGEATSFFANERGMWQGCPLPPLLFILALEGLIILLKLHQRDGIITSIKVSRLVKVLHWFFVDNIIIATKADQREWQEIKSILNLFCRTSGLQIIESKSTFHYSGLLEADIETFKTIFPFGYHAISQGLRYLRYHLKTDCYKATD